MGANSSSLGGSSSVVCLSKASSSVSSRSIRRSIFASAAVRCPTSAISLPIVNLVQYEGDVGSAAARPYFRSAHLTLEALAPRHVRAVYSVRLIVQVQMIGFLLARHALQLCH